MEIFPTYTQFQTAIQYLEKQLQLAELVAGSVQLAELVAGSADVQLAESSADVQLVKTVASLAAVFPDTF